MWQYGNHWSPLPKQFWKKGKDRNKIAVFEDREGGEEVETVTFFYNSYYLSVIIGVGERHHKQNFQVTEAYAL